MVFDPERAEIRFGCGLSPRIAPVASLDAMLARLAGPDDMAARFPIDGLAALGPELDEFRKARVARRRAKTDADRKAAKDRQRDVHRAFRRRAAQSLSHSILRRVMAEDAMRERLTAFWGDHFTATGKNNLMKNVQVAYIEDAIRPHVTGRFADMLKAVITHPFMLGYLDQNNSVGPGSKLATKSKKKRGLNENLARELLELHTVGKSGPYTQADVRQLAELLTGLTVTREVNFAFQPGFAEPGPETVLGKSYGGGKPAKLDEVLAVLDDLATHPATADHLARKLAVHFVTDAPDDGLVAHLAARFRDTGGDLPAVYAALLEHPAAWSGAPGNVKTPFDFISSGLRALAIVPEHLPTGRRTGMRDALLTPMALMGQPWGQAPGPDGWPEADIAWITPQRLAARLQWAMTTPFSLIRLLPDPREFVTTALGGSVPERLRFAVSAAESRAEGVGLILASPAFQRM